MSRLIDADKLRKDIQYVLDTLGEPTKYGLRQAMSIIDKTPTVDTERHGYWIKDRLDSIRKCSLCGAVIYRHEDLFDYCPWCGALMEEEVKE